MTPSGSSQSKEEVFFWLWSVSRWETLLSTSWPLFLYFRLFKTVNSGLVNILGQFLWYWAFFRCYDHLVTLLSLWLFSTLKRSFLSREFWYLIFRMKCNFFKIKFWESELTSPKSEMSNTNAIRIEKQQKKKSNIRGHFDSRKFTENQEMVWKFWN